jgi:hypothetical protein
MDWDLAITRNSKALKRIIEVLFALLGLDGERLLRGFPARCTAPCWRCCGRQSPPCGGLLSLWPGMWW